MGNRLEEYPDLMTKEEVAEVLRCAASMVPRGKKATGSDLFIDLLLQ